MEAGFESRQVIANANRIVVKIGSSSLTRPDGHLDVDALTALVDVVAARRNAGDEVILITSGAVSAGRGPLGLPGRPKDLATAQATASVGQGILVARYTAAFAARNLRVGQVLLTADDTIRRTHYRNAQRALDRLLDMGIVPIVNENDAVATDEIKFGDNDRLAALVSHIVRADAMVLLTDIDGLYDGPPNMPGTKRIPEVRSASEVVDVDVSSAGSGMGTGGMQTKLASVMMATASGVPVVLTNAPNISKALSGEETGTWFPADGKRQSTRRLWLAHAARTSGHLTLDEGAVNAVMGGKASLLAAGIVSVEGDFAAGDPVELCGEDGKVFARGIVNFDDDEIPELMGRSIAELREELGEDYGRTVVHRDDLVLLTKKKEKAELKKPKKGKKKKKAAKKAKLRAQEAEGLLPEGKLAPAEPHADTETDPVEAEKAKIAESPEPPVES